MSYDVFFNSFPPNAKLLDDVPEDFDAPPLGPRAVVIKKLLAAVPSLSDDGTGTLVSDEVAIEVFIGDEDPCTNFMVALRGGPEALAAIDAICKAGFRAVAPEVDEIVTSGEQLAKALGAWEQYRDYLAQKLAKPNPPNKPPRHPTS